MAHDSWGLLAGLGMGYDSSMPKGLLEIQCPCCEAMLKIDPETRAVIAHKMPEKPKPIEDLAAEVAKLKGAASRRDEVFQKQFAEQKIHGKVLEKKFDELFQKHQKEWAEMANGMRRPHQCLEAAPWTGALSLSWGGRNVALGWCWSDR